MNAATKDFALPLEAKATLKEALGSHRAESLEDTQAVDVSELGVFYDSHNTAYWIPDQTGCWTKVSESGARRFLKSKGIRNHKDAFGMSQMDRTLLAINQELYVGYVGPLAGRKAGAFVHQGNRVLVTNSPKLIEPEKGDFPVIREFLARLLGEVQLPYFFAWAKVAVQSLRDGRLRPGQALVLAGPQDCGKSVLQNLIVTPLLGGRSAKPYQFMAGNTQFNSHMFAAEHQMIEDDVPLTDIRARRKLAAHLKQITATEENLNHAKNKQALTLSVFWRVTISCNDEPENLMILPPMDESITDKVILFKVNKGPMPLPTETDEERAALGAALHAELPALMAFLIDFTIPQEIRGARYGVKEYHHPDILDVLNALSPEQRLMDIIDACLFRFEIPKTWKGTAIDLERELTADDCSMKQEARKLFSFYNAAATYLGRLEKREPTRFRRRRTNCERLWEIHAVGA